MKILLKNTPKEAYRKYINARIQKGVFKYYMRNKEKSKTKIKKLSYDSIIIQPYLTMNTFSTEDKKLLISLRSQCYDAKTN